MHFLDFIVFAVYLVVIIGMGYVVGKRQKNTEDYFLAGRGMNWWPIAISIFATAFSSISYIAIPGEAYNFGCTMWVNCIVSVLALPVMLLVFLRFFYNMKLWTVNEYLERRYSPIIRTLNSTLFLFMRLVYLGVVLYATSMLLETSLGLPPVVSILIIGVVTTIYTGMGGMEAVIWTDVFQTVVLMGGVLLVIGFAAWYVPGGLSGVWKIAADNHRTFNLGAGAEIWRFSAATRVSIYVMLINLPIAMIIPATDQMNLQRCMSCRNFGEVVRAVCCSFLGFPPISLIFYFAGLSVFAYFTIRQPEIITSMRGDKAFCHFISTQLPVGTRGLLLAGVLAAVMSTVSAVLNSMSTVFVKDIYQRTLRPGREEKHYLSFAKLVTVLSGAIALAAGLGVLFLVRERNIPLLEVSNVSLGGLASFSSAIFIAGLLLPTVGTRAILCGLATAFPVLFYLTVFRYLLLPVNERIGFIYLGVTSILVAVGVALLASLLMPDKDKGKFRYTIWSRWFTRE